MPWKKVTSMDAITRFVMQAQSDRFTITELCEQFGISRKPATNIWALRPTSWLKGLAERSHRAPVFRSHRWAVEAFDRRGTPAAADWEKKLASPGEDIGIESPAGA